MGYSPKSWGVGDPVAYADLNHIETQFGEAYDYFLDHDHDTRYYNKTAMRAAFWYAGNDGPVSGSDADLIYKASGNLHAAAFAGLGIPAGLIIWWEGALETIPSGCHIANGEAGTRDLRDRFIICAGTGSGYSVGDTGGSATFTASGTVTVDSHTLTVAEMAPHRHPFTDVYGNGAGAYSEQAATRQMLT